MECKDALCKTQAAHNKNQNRFGWMATRTQWQLYWIRSQQKCINWNGTAVCHLLPVTQPDYTNNLFPMASICDRMKIGLAKRQPKPKARTNDVSTFPSVAIWTMATDKQLIVTLSECVKCTLPKAICWHLAYVVVCRLTFSSVTNHIVILIENTVKRLCANEIMFIGTSNESQWDSWCLIGERR